MRLGSACLVLAGALALASPAAALNFVGADGGYAQPVGKTGSFASNGTALELRWRHFNRGHTAYEFVVGYLQMGLEGEVQNTIAKYDALMRYKNMRAQQQGGLGDGYIVPEYGIFETFYGGANLLVEIQRRSRLASFVSIGAGAYNWRLPFRIKWRRSPFFGEQHAYQPPAQFYSGVFPEEVVDFTKHQTNGGLSAAIGATVRLTRKLQLDGTARAHLIFSSGAGNREEGVDDQDYLDHLTFVLFKGGLNYRF